MKEEIISLNPENILIIKADVYEPVKNLLSEIDNKYVELNISSRVLNKRSIPFPGSGQQVRFREMVSEFIDYV